MSVAFDNLVGVPAYLTAVVGLLYIVLGGPSLRAGDEDDRPFQRAHQMEIAARPG